MKLIWQKNSKKGNWIQLVKFLPVILSRTRIVWFSLQSYTPRLNKKHVCMSFLQFGQRRIYCWYLYFAVQPHFSIVFGSMGRCSLQYVWYLSLSIIFWTYTCILIRILVVNQCLSQFYSKINKSIIHLEEIFHRQICIHLSARNEKIKNSDGPPCCSLCTLQTNLVSSIAIMTGCIVIVHCPPVSAINPNKFSILELDYLSIKHPYIFLLTLHHSQTRKVWHHHNIVICIL